MNPNKALWEKGDFTRIAQGMRKSGESLVAGLGITRGLKVLDLGCGDGTTALPEARHGADVLGVDIARNPVEAGTKRANEAGLTNCRFQEGDATNLSRENVSFVRDTYTFEVPDSSSKLLDAFRTFYGPTMNAFEAAEKNGRSGDLQRDLDGLFNSHNKSGRPDTTSIPATFLRVTVAVV